jgi:hypothetical protein
LAWILFQFGSLKPGDGEGHERRRSLNQVGDAFTPRPDRQEGQGATALLNLKHET